MSLCSSLFFWSNNISRDSIFGKEKVKHSNYSAGSIHRMKTYVHGQVETKQVWFIYIVMDFIDLTQLSVDQMDVLGELPGHLQCKYCLQTMITGKENKQHD